MGTFCLDTPGGTHYLHGGYTWGHRKREGCLDTGVYTGACRKMFAWLIQGNWYVSWETSLGNVGLLLVASLVGISVYFGLIA